MSSAEDGGVSIETWRPGINNCGREGGDNLKDGGPPCDGDPWGTPCRVEILAMDAPFKMARPKPSNPPRLPLSGGMGVAWAGCRRGRRDCEGYDWRSATGHGIGSPHCLGPECVDHVRCQRERYHKLLSLCQVPTRTKTEPPLVSGGIIYIQ